MKTSSNRISSQPDWLVTWALRLLFFPLLFLCFFLLLLLPLVFLYEEYLDYSEVQLSTILITVTFFSGIAISYYYGIKYILKIKNKAIIHIQVDEQGIHYTHTDKTISSVLYKDLEYSNKPYIEDVFVKYVGGRAKEARLTVFWLNPSNQTEEKTIDFMMDLAYSYYPKNRGEMRAVFIKHIRNSDKGLSVSSNVFSEFYINPKTYKFERKKRMKVVIAAAFLFLLIFAVIYYFV